ncbi:MAG TPA: lysophospholipid acyltransferase family protein [Methylomirabilota bacterium]|nr:lysophospholipid acyltransferase family protein [Methylomirabilota bacterium]
MRQFSLMVVLFRLLIVALLTLFWGPLVIFLSFFDPHAERAALLIRFWARGVLRTCGIHLRVYGREHLDPQQAYLFMSNHQSNFDIPILMAAFDTLQVRWVSKREVRKVPIIGLCMQRTQQVLVDRESPTQAVVVIRQVKALLDAGISVIFFPEGTRTRDGRLQAFKPGGFAVAVEAGVPVVPVTVRGSRALWPPGGINIRPGVVEVFFHHPIWFDSYVHKKAAREMLLTRVREAIAAQLQEESGSPAAATATTALQSYTGERAERPSS